MRKMMFNAILIGGLIAMILGSTGLAGKMSHDFIVAGALLMGCIVCGLFMEFAGRGKAASRSRRTNNRLLRQMMEQEKACRAEERRQNGQQQAAMLELLRQQGQQQTEAIKAIAEVSRYSMQSLTQVTRNLLSAGAKLDYDTETASYVAQLKGQAYRVSDEEAEEWANVAPTQVNPKLLLTEGEYPK